MFWQLFSAPNDFQLLFCAHKEIMHTFAAENRYHQQKTYEKRKFYSASW
jgi:hypothetical protein